MLDFGVSIHLMIFKKKFFYLLKVLQITLVWLIIINVVGRWSFIRKALLMAQLHRRLVHHIKSQQTDKKIVEHNCYKVLVGFFVALLAIIG